MQPTEPGPEYEPPSLRAAHRARHFAAAPDAYAEPEEYVHPEDLADASGYPGYGDPPPVASGWPGERTGAGPDPHPGLDWPVVGDGVGDGGGFGGVGGGGLGGWDLAREPGDRRTVPATDPGVADRRGARTAAAADRADAPPASRAGRNLPAAIGVGVVLGGAVLASLLLWKPAFYAVLVVAVGIGTWELVRAVHSSGPRPPLIPLLLGGPVMAGLAWYGGVEALPYGLLGTVIAVLVWRLADGPAGYERDVVPALLIAVYVPFLAGFAVLLAAPADGKFRVLGALAGVVMSDIGGYAAGVFLGRHPMAPSVSPKKSWEGFAGSLFATAVGSAILLYYLLDATWWRGALVGLAIAAAATFGDLAESMLKRDLKIKDMSSLLPGHGGLMDRLDSILLAAPTAYVMLTLLL